MTEPVPPTYNSEFDTWVCPHCRAIDMFTYAETGVFWYKAWIDKDGLVEDTKGLDSDVTETRLFCRECDVELAFPGVGP